ncbi:Ger(x)C family spore germination protein [Paenibacillus nanensis]|nr:Ger(x)C family spore germination protein [Paenibacillus nanensis]
MLTTSGLRKIMTLLLCASFTLLTTGCWDRIEVNDLAIVTAAGFDLTENNQIRLSVQIFSPGNPSQSGSSMGEQQQGMPKALVESAVGKDTADAAASLQELLSRNLFWGHADVFIISERLARHGITEPLDYLSRHPQPRERTNLYVSRGSPEEILQWQPDIERNSGEMLREMAVIQTGLNITLLETMVSLSEEAHTALIPIVGMKKSGNKQSPALLGSAAFHGLKMKQTYSVKATRGLLWLRDEINEATITSRINDEGYASINIFKSRSKITPVIHNGKWKIKLHLEAAGNLTENSTTLNAQSPEDIKKIENAFTALLQQRIEKAVKLAKESQTDVLGFAEAFHQKYPSEWLSDKADWGELLRDVEVEYHIKLRIRRTGLTGWADALVEEDNP